MRTGARAKQARCGVWFRCAVEGSEVGRTESKVEYVNVLCKVLEGTCSCNEWDSVLSNPTKSHLHRKGATYTHKKKQGTGRVKRRGQFDIGTFLSRQRLRSVDVLVNDSGGIIQANRCISL